MQRQHSYPSHRNQYPTTRQARAGATVDDQPLPPKTADRTKRIRAVFLVDCAGYASVAEIVDRCEALGLLEQLSTYRSAYETVAAALRPITTDNVWASIHSPAYVRPTSPPG